MTTHNRSRLLTCDHLCHSADAFLPSNFRDKLMLNIGIVIGGKKDWDRHQAKYHTSCQCPSPNTLFHQTTHHELVKYAARIYLSRNTDAMRVTIMQMYRQAWSCLYAGAPPEHQHAPLDFSLDERYPVYGITWGSSPLYPLVPPHPLGPAPMVITPPINQVPVYHAPSVPAPASNHPPIRSVWPWRVAVIQDTFLSLPSPLLPGPSPIESSNSTTTVPKAEIPEIPENPPAVEDRVPSPPFRPSVIPPIVDHLLNEIDELKDALTKEVEIGARREVEMDSLRGQVALWRNAIVMGREEHARLEQRFLALEKRLDNLERT
ncbi:hypothetical protein DFP72DRAFT_919333 [Ephemerocybe angulata]|uniref:Uncharacterized protein n=1 Tax=Ephemerocybe angulata TaxID=980116 RepID=A0A8H6HIL2_9AGAR|nr:hypothetical protein DFP72DRAFT_919333 [Tulosesus angulatus]